MCRPVAAAAAAALLLVAAGCPAADRQDPAGAGPGPAARAPDGHGSVVREPVFDTRMYVRAAGDPEAPAVVLVHGLGQAAGDDWHRVIDALADDYRVIAPDLPGFGRSQVPAGTLSPARYAELLRWLIERRDLGRVHLVGHSMGGAVALYYASAHPGDVNRVAVADVAGILHRAAFLRTLVDPQADLRALPDGIRMTVRRVLDAGERLIERLVTGPDPTGYLREHSAAWRSLLAGRPNANAALALIKTDFAGRLERIARPVTIIWGGADAVAPMRTAHLLRGRLGHSRLEVIDGAGHVPMRTHPQDFLAALRPALAGPVPAEQAPPAQGPRRRAHRCVDQVGQRISGRYERIVLESCVDARLVDVEARRIVIEDSLVEMTRVAVTGPRDGAALEVRDSALRATDVRISGAPAVLADGARMDLAGVSLHAPGAALRVERGSGFIFSLSEIHSGLHTGYLHGMAETAHAPLDRVERVRSDYPGRPPGAARASHPAAPR